MSGRNLIGQPFLVGVVLPICAGLVVLIAVIVSSREEFMGRMHASPGDRYRCGRDIDLPTRKDQP